MPTNRTRVLHIIACLATALQSLGCAYVMTAPTPPSQERIRIVAKAPEAYVVHVEAGRSVDYQVPPDGRLTLAVPAYRRACSVYLFNAVKVSDGGDPLKGWAVEVNASGKAVRRLSFRQLTKLATDSDGYRLLKVRP